MMMVTLGEGYFLDKQMWVILGDHFQGYVIP